MSKSLRAFVFEPVFAKYVTDPNRLENHYEKLKVESGDTLKFKRLGEPGFYVIASGLLKLEVMKPQPRLLRLCLPGDLVGYGAWSTDRSSSYFLTAIERSEVQFWRQSTFELLRAKTPQLNEFIIEHLVRSLLNKDDRIALLETSSAEARVAELLCWLAMKFGVKSNSGILIDVAIDRESLAQLAGTSPVSFARIIGDFVERDIVKRRRWKIQIENINLLRAIADGKVPNTQK